MQLWFWAALLSAVFAGVSNFLIKVAAKRNYDSGVFTLYSAIVSVIFSVTVAIVWGGMFSWIWIAHAASFLSGFLGGINTIGKIQALRNMDTTLYFPLFKTLSPIIAVILGILWFDEAFTMSEWIGIIVSITVPLLLISKVENTRQTNLKLGLIMVVVTSFIGALGWAFSKYSTFFLDDVLWLGVSSGVGVLAGSIAGVVYKNGFATFKRLHWKQHDRSLLWLAFFRGSIASFAVFCILFAYVDGGTLGIVHTINSMYILIPIVLAIIFYNEHWNLQKAIAIALSILALAFLH